MIVLNNIVFENGIISYDYLYELDVKAGHVTYDVANDKVISVIYSGIDESYRRIKRGFSKSLDAIQRVMKLDKIPEKYSFSWY